MTKLTISDPQKVPSPKARVLATAARWDTALAVFLVLLVAYFTLTTSGFFPSITGFLGLTQLFVPSALVAVGLTPVVLMGGIDLSVGATASLSAVFMASCWQAGLSIWIAALLALVLGAVIGAINATLVTRAGFAPLIATLATSFIYDSIATVLAGNSPPYGFPSGFTAIGQDSLGGVVPYQLLIFLALAGVIAVVIARTAVGRRIRMIGYSRGAARYAGVHVWRVTFFSYIVCSTMAALAGILLGSYYSAVQSDVGDALLLSAVTMVVLGGVDVFGGAGGLLGVVIAALIVGLLEEGLLIRGDSALESSMATGILLIVGMVVRVWYAPGRSMLARLVTLRGGERAREGPGWRPPRSNAR
jgi:ribose/xylose/arabinose/galactoside ABC-type transport system permease subunit